MSTGNQDDSLPGLAKRWLKTQLRFTGDPGQGRRDRAEADALEQQMEDRARQDVMTGVFNAVLPPKWKQKLRDLERHKMEQDAEAQRRRRAEHEARPRASAHLSLRGVAWGDIDMDIPVRVSRPDDPGQSLTVELEPLDPIPLGQDALTHFTFAAPAYRGPGVYDLTTLASGPGADDFDASEFQLTLKSSDESFYWWTDYGPGTVTLADDGRTFDIRLAMQDSGSRQITIEGTVVIPVNA
jgi:hypothetical protein